MNRFKFYKELYFQEIERKYQMKQSLKMQIGIISILLSATFYLITSFQLTNNYVENCIFIFSTVLTFILLSISILFLLKAYNNFFKGYEYSFFAYSQELDEWYQDIDNHYIKYYNDKKMGKIEFNSHLIKNITKHIDHNMYLNDKRSSSLYKSNIFMILSLFSLFFITMIYLTDYIKF